MKIEDMPLNAKTAKTIAKRVMKDNNMRLTNRFTPVISEYKFQVGDDKRISIVLDENEFVQKEQRFHKNMWRDAVEKRIKGTLDDIENVLLETISELSEYNSKFKSIK